MSVKGSLAAVLFVCIIAAPLVITILIIICKNGCCCFMISEKNAVVKETWGKYKETLGPGIHGFCPCMSKQVEFKTEYYASKLGVMQRSKIREKHISLEEESVDFPKFEVITRDNVECYIDLTVNYKVVNPADLVYNVNNMTYMLSLLINAIVRSKCGEMELDQIIEDPEEISKLQGELEDEVQTWGIRIELFKVQKVEASEELKDELEKTKQEMYNSEANIKEAKTKKQAGILNATATRDELVKEAEGQVQEIELTSEGQAEAIRNQGLAQANAIKCLIPGMGNKATAFEIANETCDLIEKINAKCTDQVLYTHGVDKLEVARNVLGCYITL